MNVSLIVCTRNRAEQLERCLDAIGLIPAGDWELVLVDNGSTDRTADVIGGARVNAPVVTVTEPTAGLARARNTGVRAAAGELVAFTDDDCYPTPTFIDDVLSAFSSGAAAVGGRVLLHDPEDLPVTIQTSTMAVDYPPRSMLLGGEIHGANMAFRRSALDAIGGFDETLGAGTAYAAEDIQALAMVLWVLSETVRYDPVPTVSHHHGRRTAEEHAQLNGLYTRGRVAYFTNMIRRRVTRRAYMRAWAGDVVGEVLYFRSLRQSIERARISVSYWWATRSTQQTHAVEVGGVVDLEVVDRDVLDAGGAPHQRRDRVGGVRTGAGVVDHEPGGVENLGVAEVDDPRPLRRPIGLDR